MKKLYILFIAGTLSLLGGCAVTDLFVSDSSQQADSKPLIRYLSGSSARGQGRSRNRPHFGSGENQSGFNFKGGSGVRMQMEDRMKSFSTGDQELFKQMRELREAGNLTGSDEIRAKLQAKYPDFFQRPGRVGN